MNEQIEVIRNEIKRLEEIHERNLKKPMERGRIGYAHGVVACCDRILSFIDSLPEEPAPKGYDEAYLNECIAKASKTWEGVDVDKYMDEVRGNRPKSSDSLEEAAENYIAPIENDEGLDYINFNGRDIKDAFIAGAQWQKEQIMNSPLVSIGNTESEELQRINYENGKKDMKEQMMKEAVEGTVMDFSSNRPRPQVNVLLDPHKYHTGEKVHIIIVKED